MPGWLLSRVHLFATLWTVARQAPLSRGFPRRDYWSELPFSSSRGSPQPSDWIPVSCVSCIAGWVFTHWATGEAPEHQYLPSPISGVGKIAMPCPEQYPSTCRTFFFFFSLWPWHLACGIFSNQRSKPSSLGAWSLNHWTAREVHGTCSLTLFKLLLTRKGSVNIVSRVFF